MSKKPRYAVNVPGSEREEEGHIIGKTKDGLPTFDGHILGQLRDKPDKRDFLYKVPPELYHYLQASIDLRSYDTPIFDQGQLGSCAANAAVGCFQWLQKRQTGNFFTGSRLFVYKIARDMDGVSGDVGTYMRTVSAEMAQYGVCHEELWPYNISQFDVEPNQSAKNDAAQNRSTSYWRCDGDGQDGGTVLNNVKGAMGSLPVMFAFTVCSNFSPDGAGRVPFPNGSVAGGHGVVAVGFNDDFQNLDGSYGAVLFRNSWGTGWGASGYGWMPYNFFMDRSYGGYDAWVVAAESQITPPTPPPTPTPSPSPPPVGGKQMKATMGLDILPFMSKMHNGQPTKGIHTVKIYPIVPGEFEIGVRVRRWQPGLD